MSSFPTGYSPALVFFVNGRKVVDDAVNPEWTLLQYLRKKLMITGTKLGCGEGGCGACTVMVSRLDRKTDSIDNYTVNACLCPVASLHGMAVVTVEGIGSTDTKLHPVQERLAKSHGSQCGFCTPGFVMSMYTLLRNNPQPTMQEIEENLAGNLCRCTGYRPILEGFRSFSKPASTGAGCGISNCCMLKQNGADNSSEIYNDGGVTSVLVEQELFLPYDPSQDPIFPPELKVLSHLDQQNLCFVSSRVTYYRPTTLNELLALKDKFPHAKLAAGNTEIGTETKFKNQHYPVIINPTWVQELSGIRVTESDVIFGACTTLSMIEEDLPIMMQKLPDYRARVTDAILEMLKWFAGRQIRNVATIGGNIVTGSPISDLLPILMAARAVLVLQSHGSLREVPLDDKFFLGYRKHLIKPNEVLLSIRVPLTNENTYFYAYKQARRKEDDIAIVNSGMQVSFSPGLSTIDSIRLAFGGMGPTTRLSTDTTHKLMGLNWNEDTLEVAISMLIEEFSLEPSAPGGMVDYRNSLTASFFVKFFLSVRKELHLKMPHLVKGLSHADEDATKVHAYQAPQSTQLFQRVPPNQENIDPIGRPLVHASAIKQATGEAAYLDDFPSYVNELYAAFVLSKKAKASILSIDDSKALAIPGVELFLSYKNVPEHQNVLKHLTDETAFAKGEVQCVGEIVGMIVACDQATAQRAAKLVEITYGDIGPPIITIEDAIKAKSIFGQWETVKGDVEQAFKKSEHVLEGTVRMGGQEHFYMETHAALVIPREGGEIECICSTQALKELQNHIAYALGIPSTYVVCKTKRLGGGFGGKETKPSSFAVPLALAARRLKRPVRVMLDRDEDMLITGGRHPFLAKWKASFASNGKFDAFEVKAYGNCGCTQDLSIGVLTRFVFSVENGYSIPNSKVTCYGCTTNLPSNTAFRGFGGPQGSFVMEQIMDVVSEFLKIDPRKVREINLAKPEGDVSSYGQMLGKCTVKQCWEDVMNQSNYIARRQQVITFNSEHKYRKRGISILPTRFCVAFGFKALNQGGALVHIYSDGNVLLSHGGVEMGQGLHTKMMQVASRVLKIPIEKFHILETSTETVPNCSPSAASMSSDLFGMAILNACKTLYSRLEPYRKQFPDESWCHWVQEAFQDRVSLSATGFYKVPNIDSYDWKNKTGDPFSYFCYGAAATEVEIDCLTGDHTVLRTDIVMDVGESLNPAIDIGQVEGAFAQGMGLFTLEELLYSPDGTLLTKGPGAYKIPSVSDIPRQFNVTLLRGSPNPKAVFSSKAVGEPPLFLAASVFFAIRDAIISTKDTAKGELLVLDSPATAEKIRMACKDVITDQIKTAKPGTFKPWAINV